MDAGYAGEHLVRDQGGDWDRDGLLVDRGLVRYDAPIAAYWPEFAQNGKAQITVSQLMSHQAGLCRATALEDFYDRDLVTRRLAAQAPTFVRRQAALPIPAACTPLEDKPARARKRCADQSDIITRKVTDPLFSLGS